MLKQPDTYLIYGANSSIGSTLAKKVLPNVRNLILFYHKNTDRIKDLFSYPNVRVYQSDIRDFDDFTTKMKSIYDQIDIKEIGAVFMPAIRSYDHKKLTETSLDIAKEIIDVNLLGAIHFLKGVLENERKIDFTPQKKVVLLSSNVSRTGLKYGSVYAATKAAIVNLVRSASMEEGMSNTLINAISPGPVNTFDEGFSDEYKRFRKEYFETQKTFTSLNKVANIEEVCSLICFLTSLENTHITGEEIFITGGAL